MIWSLLRLWNKWSTGQRTTEIEAYRIVCIGDYIAIAMGSIAAHFGLVPGRKKETCIS